MTSATVPTGRGEADVTRLPLLRRAMVRQSEVAAAVPVFYLRLSADVTDLLAARARSRAAGDPVPSVNDAVVRAVALGLRDVPAVNAAYVDGVVERYPRVNVGVAVAIPGGLVVPAIYDADRKDVHAISTEARAVAELAIARKLTRELLADATFTVSNLGMHGIVDFDPLINPPQAAILGVGAAVADAGGRSHLRLTLGCDHRVLTGAEAAPFLGAVRERLEDVSALLGSAEDAG
jgi:pyruvate dehydrogenase E2 component (dihydrolipoamide acetyltransferase)